VSRHTLTYQRTADGRLLLHKPSASLSIQHVVRRDNTVLDVHLTDFRVTYAHLQGANTARVLDVLTLGQEGCEMRAVMRAAMICATPTPWAYYGALPHARTMPSLFEEQTCRRRAEPTAF